MIIHLTDLGLGRFLYSYPGSHLFYFIFFYAGSKSEQNNVLLLRIFTYCHARIKKVLSEGSNFDVFFVLIVSKGREDSNTTIREPMMAQH